MRTFTEAKALQILNNLGADIRSKTIIVKNGLKGLTACSAFDYLVNHCGYKGNISSK